MCSTPASAESCTGRLTRLRCLEDGKNPLIALEDVGPYSLWMLDNSAESADLLVKVATDEVSCDDIAKTFTNVAGKKASHQFCGLEQYLPLAEQFPNVNVMANWAAGPHTAKDESTMT